MAILNVYPLQAKENKTGGGSEPSHKPQLSRGDFQGGRQEGCCSIPHRSQVYLLCTPVPASQNPDSGDTRTNTDLGDQRGPFAKKQRWQKVASGRSCVGRRLGEFQQNVTELPNQGAEEESSLHSNRRTLRFYSVFQQEEQKFINK